MIMKFTDEDISSVAGGWYSSVSLPSSLSLSILLLHATRTWRAAYHGFELRRASTNEESP